MTFASVLDNVSCSAPNLPPWRNPLAALVAVNKHLNGDDGQDACLRAVKFMSYELHATCNGKTEDEIFYELNIFFFQVKNFKILNTPCLLKTILEERTGCGIALSLLYIHLANELGLRLQLVHWPLHAILKWEGQNKARYFDLEQNGHVLSEDELLLMINKHKEQVRTLELPEALFQYLTYLSMHYRQNEDFDCLHKTLGLLLELSPENTHLLAERALLRRDLGLIREAVCDFKRYFSFTNRAEASPEIVSAYENLREHEIS